VPALAVVVPTRNREELLVDCVASLARQTFTDLELLVIDDGSDRPLAPAVAAAVPAARCHRQAPSGLNPARNVGAELTSAPLIAFVDDDTLVPPGWAQAVVDAFGATGCSGLGGRVELALPHDPPRWLTPGRRSYLAELELGPERRWMRGRELPVGANCAVRRDELERVGGFSDGLDRVGTSLISSGDTDFFLRLRAAGGTLLYEPAAWLQHRVPPDRLTFEWFRRRAYAQGVTDELMRGDAAHSRRSRRLREHVRAGRAAPIAVKSVLSRRGTANAQIWLSYCRGRLAAIDGAARDE
jgi:glycosyltransferase involved in cell wall biosynthesis